MPVIARDELLRCVKLPENQQRTIMNKYEKLLLNVDFREEVVRLAQKECSDLDLDVGPIDGKLGPRTKAAIEQRLIMKGIKVLTPKRKEKPRNTTKGKRTAFKDTPGGSYQEMVAYYGKPGDESNLVRLPFPYKMRLYTRKAPLNVRSHRVHKKAKEPLEAILEAILKHYGTTEIARLGLDVFGGIYNNRSVRGGRSKSKHAWGVAIDINPGENMNRMPWKASKIGEFGWANMPVETIEIFERHGWTSGAKAWGRDAMHFARTKTP